MYEIYNTTLKEDSRRSNTQIVRLTYAHIIDRFNEQMTSNHHETSSAYSHNGKELNHVLKSSKQ